MVKCSNKIYNSFECMTFQQQVSVLFFLLEAVTTDKISLIHLDFDLVASCGSKRWVSHNRIIISLMICLHKWFQSDVGELFFFFLGDSD